MKHDGESAETVAPTLAHATKWRVPVFSAAITLALIGSSACLAQSMPGGGMGGGHGGHGGRGSGDHAAPVNKSDTGPAYVPNPLRAMLGEMRKLRADLLLTSTQIGAWSAMEDALRECAELNRSRNQALTDSNGAAIDAVLFVQDMADNERALAEAMGKFSAAMKSALATLNPRQLKLTQEGLAAAIDSELHPSIAP